MGRFINTDDVTLIGANGDFASLNLFVYCGNNPASREDSEGNFWHIVVGATIGGIFSRLSKALECDQSNTGLKETVSQVLVSTVCGAVGGALAATGIGAGGQMIIGAVLGAAESAANQTIMSGSVDATTLAVDTLAGLVGGFSGGKGASCGSKFMSYHRKEFMKNLSLNGLDSAVDKFIKHTGKWSLSNLIAPTIEGVGKAFAGNKMFSGTAQVIGKVWNRKE